MKKLAFLALLVSGCASIDLPRSNDPELARGRERYIARCSGCHALPDPRSKSGQEWHVALDEMAPRAKLSPEDRDAVERYLRTLAP